MCHPGFVDAELERLDSLTTLREHEFAFFNSDDFPAAAGRSTASRLPQPGWRMATRLPRYVAHDDRPGGQP